MKIEIYTDGACRGNPGPGGFGLVVVDGNVVKYAYSEECEETTNNREEMKAILHAFEYACAYFRFDDVLIYSDSAYCVNMINDWIWTWAKNDWKNSKKKTVENLDLVKDLHKYLTMEFFPCQVIKVRGHNGEAANELADALATNNERKYQKILLENGMEERIVDFFEKI